jgi:HK97 family phage major capsid protein
MSAANELKVALDGLGQSWEEYKKANDERVAKLAKGESVVELDAKMAKIERDVNVFVKAKKDIEFELEAQKERIEEIESKARQPGMTVQEKAKAEYKDAFIGWMRKQGQSPEHEAKMSELMKKDITIGTPSAGGYGVPEEISRQIEVLERKFSPVRDLVKVVRTGTSDYKELVSIGNTTTSGWIGETGTRSATATPQLREVTPTHGELYAYPQVSEWSLDDIFFNVEEWLTSSIAEDFAIAESTALLTGNGSSKPTGMLNTAPTTVADNASPMRAAAVYQFIANGASPLTSLQPDKLIDLIYGLNSRYRSGAVFTMNSSTTGVVRKLKDADRQYLWQPGLQAGEPDRLLGYPVVTWEQMADIAINAHPIAFGNFKRGYLLVDRVGLRITRDNVTNVGYVRFYVRRREGGIVLNNDAIKFLKMA